RTNRWGLIAFALAGLAAVLALADLSGDRAAAQRGQPNDPNAAVNQNARTMIEVGRKVFRFDTFGDEAFWGDALGLHRAIAGKRFGGVGPGLSPRSALALGLRVDADALPGKLVAQLKQGKVNLDDPAVTLDLLRLNAVVGVTGFFDERGQIRSFGIQCALCHS